MRGIQEEIREGIHPFMKQLFYRIAEGGQGLTMDGVWVYNENAQFVGGKVINLCSYVVTELLEGAEQEEAVKALEEIIGRCADLPMKTWGILNAVTGLYRMEIKGIRSRAVPPMLWERLKQILDWRTFIDCDDNLALIQLPTNYYGVAFGIARYRELLGWENEDYSKKLLDRLLEHIDRFSGEYGFMDETPGQGRFDRYSILVPAEITSSILNTGMELPEQIVRMLRKSADICLSMANTRGCGFSYGRSTGAYGDTGVMEVLWAAARVKGLLDREEEKIAYTYCAALIKRFMEFWIDPEMQSVNLWEKGRRTDRYRNKNRILSENLSLCMQVASLNAWESMGDGVGAPEGRVLPEGRDLPEGKALLEGKTLLEGRDLPKGEILLKGRDLTGEDDLQGSHRNLDLKEMCSYAGITGRVTFFTKGEYERALAVVRDREHVWLLPLISGGSSYYQKSPYLPIPYEQFVVTGVPDESYALLTPELTLADQTKVMPAVYMRGIKWEQGPDSFRIRFVQDGLCIMNTAEMERFDKIHSETMYTWRQGEITREDIFYLDDGVKVSGIRMEFLTFSEEPEAVQDGMQFGTGKVREITAKGYEMCSGEALDEADPSCHTPDGALKNHVVWKSVVLDGSERKIAVSWTMKYR